MTKLVDVADLKSAAFGCAGSSPAAGTKSMGRSPTPMLPTPVAEPMPQTMSTPVAEPMPPKPSPSDTVEVQPVVPERKTRRVIGATLRAFEQVRVLRLDALKRLADALRQCDVDELAGMLESFVTTKSGLRT
jgi:hypothetical protein